MWKFPNQNVRASKKITLGRTQVEPVPLYSIEGLREEKQRYGTNGHAIEPGSRRVADRPVNRRHGGHLP